MKKEQSLIIGFLLFPLALALCGCGKHGNAATSGQAHPGNYFKTTWQDESQFIVTEIVSDLAEMAYYAKHKSVPSGRQYSVRVTERPSPPPGPPVYLIEVTFENSTPPIQQELTVDGPIWSPEVYATVVDRLFAAAGLAAGELIPPGAQDDQLLSDLAKLTARQLAQRNLSLSKALTARFRDAALHENAALLLGAFMLRENSGDFFDIRFPLCRATAHLAMARGLAGKSGPNLNGELAEALLLTLMNNQKAALEKIALLQNASPAAQPWGRALRARNTDDYRPLAQATNLTHLEKVEVFRASCRAVSSDVCWRKLSDVEKAGVCDYARIVNASHYSVEVGHELLAVGLKGELAELAETYAAAHGEPLKQSELVQALNQAPERCFEAAGAGRATIIGWGQWAMFSQRHLCHALEHNFDFMNRQWGVPDEAKGFSQRVEQGFSGLRLYPFVRRFNATEVNDYHRAVDEALACTIETPHLVSAANWNELRYRPDFAELYAPSPNLHLNEWHQHNPPPGTVYDSLERIRQASLADRPDTLPRLEQLHELAPHDTAISFKLLWVKYQGKATFEQVEEVYHPVLEYESGSLVSLAGTLDSQPVEYEKVMLKAAAIAPYHYYRLADYFFGRQDEAKTALYLERGMKLDPDAVAAANRSGWLVKYYQRHGMTSKAVALADEAAETYSSRGLQAKAELLESMGKYGEALDYYKKIEERYDESGQLISFLARYKAKTGSTRYDSQLQARLPKVFPHGIEKVTLNQLQGRPQSGVRINENNALLQKYGLQLGDIIVALYGMRVYNFEQYDYARESTLNPEMNFIVWRANQYLEIKASPPNHRFNANFSNWPEGR